jgi:hypothetical protein
LLTKVMHRSVRAECRVSAYWTAYSLPLRVPATSRVPSSPRGNFERGNGEDVTGLFDETSTTDRSREMVSIDGDVCLR